MRTVVIVLFDGVQSLDVTGPLEVFAGANRWRSGRDHSLAGPNGPDGPAYRIRTASLGGRPVRTSSGLRLAPDESLGQDESAQDEGGPDVLLVPGGEGTRDADPDLLAWLPPGRYVDRVRLETARRRMEDIAEAMRRAFIRALGVSPAEYRRRFRPVPAR